MKFIYLLFRAFSWMVSRLPFPLLYGLSWLLRILLQYVARYRRIVINRNLMLSFPDKSRAEIRQITGYFYRNLADILLEVIKLETIKPEDLKKRCKITGTEHINHAFDNNRSVLLAIGHCGNWEWIAAALGLHLPVKGFGVVKPLSDKHFHDYLESLRHRFNPGGTIPFQNTYRALIRIRREMVSLTALASDQTPELDEINYWSKFLNQDTPFFMGVEKLARSLDFSVVFMDIKRTGRGRYTGHFQLITHDPKNTAETEITEKYIRLLEESICSQPDNWLWSHRRWKYTRDVAET